MCVIYIYMCHIYICVIYIYMSYIYIFIMYVYIYVLYIYVYMYHIYICITYIYIWYMYIYIYIHVCVSYLRYPMLSSSVGAWDQHLPELGPLEDPLPLIQLLHVWHAAGSQHHCTSGCRWVSARFSWEKFMGDFHGRFSWESNGSVGFRQDFRWNWVVNINTNIKSTHDDSVRKRAGDARPTGRSAAPRLSFPHFDKVFSEQCCNEIEHSQT